MTDPIDLDRPDLKERARALYSWDNRIRLLTDNETLRAEVERLKAELAATRKAKQENDDRFTGERDDARAERDEAWAWLPYEMRCTLTAKWTETAAPAFTPMANGPSYVDPANMLAYLAANPEPAHAAANDVNSEATS